MLVGLLGLLGGLSGCTGATGDRVPSPTASAAGGFPRSVPLVPGRVLARTHANGEWHVWVAAPDPLRGYREAQRRLGQAGFVITKDRQGTGGADGQVCTAELCVGLTGVDDPVYGASVAYEVFKPSGLS